jgi:hypothetical protein
MVMRPAPPVLSLVTSFSFAFAAATCKQTATRTASMS